MSARLRLLSMWLCALPAPALGALNSGAQFLKIGTGARPAAMGGAYTAVSDDLSALHYNPGGLGNLRQSELGVTHSEWVLGSKFDFAGYAQPLPFGMLGVGLTRLSSGEQQGRDESRNPTGGFGAADTAVALGFSRAFDWDRSLAPPQPTLWERPLRFIGMDEKTAKQRSRDLGLDYGERAPGAGTVAPRMFSRTSVGASVKLIESRVGGDAARTYAVDLGAVHHLARAPLALGVSALNLGKGLSFYDQADPLPLGLSVGAAYRLGSMIHLAVDLKHEPHEKRTDLRIGSEYILMSSFILRAGYDSQGNRPQGGGGLSAMGGLGGGFGLRFSKYQADYMFTPFGELGSVQRFSLGAKF